MVEGGAEDGSEELFGKGIAETAFVGAGKGGAVIGEEDDVVGRFGEDLFKGWWGGAHYGGWRWCGRGEVRECQIDMLCAILLKCQLKGWRLRGVEPIR